MPPPLNFNSVVYSLHCIVVLGTRCECKRKAKIEKTVAVLSRAYQDF